MPTPILINARFLTQATTGVQRYAIELVTAWDAMLDSGELDKSIVQFTLLAPRDAKDINLRNIPLRRIGRLRGQLWEQLELPMHASGHFLLNLCNSAPLMKRRQAVTIHDASVFGFPQAYGIRFRAWYKFLHRVLGKRVMLVLTDSRFSESELTKHCGIAASRIRVVYLGCEHIRADAADPSIVSRNGLNKVEFMLAVSSMSPHKNFQAIVNAIPLLKSDTQVVIAGGLNARIFGQTDMRLPENVRHLGYVSDAELRALYEHAACFVYPSFYEGFGLPPLEAMACGSPVIVARAGSLPEVCGDAAQYCDPHNIADVAANIERLMADPLLRDSLRLRGQARAQQFTWADCARNTWSAIQACGASGNPH